MGFFRKAFGRLTQDEGDRRAQSVRQWAEALPGVTLIADAAPRTVVRVAGVVEGLRVRPREGVPAIEAVVTDGSGTITALWLGRRSIPGLTLGCRLVLEGRIGGGPGDRQVVNPRFEFAPSRTEP
jgi:hypothetical protein